MPARARWRAAAVCSELGCVPWTEKESCGGGGGVGGMVGGGLHAASSLAHERAARHDLLLFCLERLGARTIQHLQHVVHAVAHALVHVPLGALDVVVQVVAEVLHVVDGPVLVLLCKMVLEENNSNKREVLATDDARDVLELVGRLVDGVLHRRRVADGAARVLELLQENFCEDLITRILEFDSKQANNTVTLGADVQRLALTVVDGDDILAGAARVARGEHLLEHRGQEVALEVAQLQGELGFLSTRNCSQVDAQGDIVLVLSLGLECTINLLQHLGAAIGQALASTTPRQGQGHHCL
mmetsp:Transcript_49745/g.125032  ORF Transcript_49745/g.125032 Transcript_49745/m.125032 type:complete len:299 (-) Transcript_49745:200-1096(-)